MAFKDMRDFLNHLGENGRLVRIKNEVALEYELAAYLRKASDMGDKGPALLFENVKGHDIQVAGGLYANRQLMLEAIGNHRSRMPTPGISTPLTACRSINYSTGGRATK